MAEGVRSAVILVATLRPLPVAFATGNLTLRPFSTVTEVLYDDALQKATGVRVIDTLSKEYTDYFAKIIFINASTIDSAAILLNSKSSRFPDGLGNDSGELGHNLMDHHSSAGSYGTFDGFQDTFYKGRRPCGFLIPRFRNLNGGRSEVNFLRGYNIQGGGKREGWADNMGTLEFGEDFKKRLTSPGPWSIWMGGWGECLPYHENKIELSKTEKDEWGMPLIRISFSFKENERLMMEDISTTCAEMLTGAGFTNVHAFNYHKVGGGTVHEMGTARMGHNPLTSVLNAHNQVHSVKNVFLTDGSCMTSSACQSPSLTYMALTARACNFAVNQLKRGEL